MSGGIARWNTSMRIARRSPLDSEHPLFILYTSGSTGKPKGILHTTGGYLRRHSCDHEIRLRSARRRCLLVHGGCGLGHRPQLRRLWSARGWRDHVYVRRRAELAGAGSLLENHRRLSGHHSLYRADGDSRVHSLGRRVGEEARSFVAALARFRRRADQSRSMDVVSRRRSAAGAVPIVDTWWQTETGAIMITPLPGAIPTKPGSATLPFFGVDAAVVDEKWRRSRRRTSAAN